jgi:hypothetical protein
MVMNHAVMSESMSGLQIDGDVMNRSDIVKASISFTRGARTIGSRL